VATSQLCNFPRSNFLAAALGPHCCSMWRLRVAKLTFGKFLFGKLHTWEVATGEIVTWEVVLEKMGLVKYLTPKLKLQSLQIIF